MLYKILVVDDEPVICKSIKMALSKDNTEVSTCDSGEEALALVAEERPDLILLDIALPGIDGLEVLKEIKKANAETLVIMITAYGDIKTVLQAVKLGAYHYIQKPIDINELDIIVNNAFSTIKLKKEVSLIKNENFEKYSFDKIVGLSPIMKLTLEKAKQIAISKNSTVLIEGESGTGKELFTRAIHYFSSRCDHPLIAINCGALPSELVESELFGYEKGAFTGALNMRNPGKFELAHEGTLLLDEISELSKPLQVKLLRVLQEKEFFRLGGTKSVKVDVRIISTTNKNLEKLIEEDKFREDLYFRLNVVKLCLPPLRERGDDIILLAKVFLDKFNREFDKNFLDISPAAVNCLKDLEWRGNVRELQNLIERVVLTETGPYLLPEHICSILSTAGNKTTALSKSSTVDPVTLNLDTLINETIKKALEIAKGNKTTAAKILGLSRSNLRYRMAKFKIL